MAGDARRWKAFSGQPRWPGMIERPRTRNSCSRKRNSEHQVRQRMPRSFARWISVVGVRPGGRPCIARRRARSEEHTSELQSLMRISYAVFCLKKKNTQLANLHNYTD